MDPQVNLDIVISLIGSPEHLSDAIADLFGGLHNHFKLYGLQLNAIHVAERSV